MSNLYFWPNLTGNIKIPGKCAHHIKSFWQACTLLFNTCPAHHTALPEAKAVHCTQHYWQQKWISVTRYRKCCRRNEDVYRNSEKKFLCLRKHDNIMIWIRFPQYSSLVKGIHGSPEDPPRKAPVIQSFDIYFCISLSKLFQNNRVTGDLRCHNAHAPFL